MPTAFLSARDGEPGEVSTTLELQPEGTEGKGGMIKELGEISLKKSFKQQTE